MIGKEEVFHYVSGQGISIPMSLHRAPEGSKKTTVIYFHGGGLIYGSRHDLPEMYRNIFLRAGYDFLAIDYPLAPESGLETILEVSRASVVHYLEESATKFGLANSRYVLFGRSAGAYLAFMTCHALIACGAPVPKAILSLYGYSRLDEKAFLSPSAFYRAFPSLSAAHKEKIVGDFPITEGSLETRFALYADARKEGSWIRTLCGDLAPETYSLSADRLAQFPPVFLSASTMDPDVPFRMSKSLLPVLRNAHLVPIYGEVHDFDRDTLDPQGAAVYREIVSWMDGV